MLIVPVSQVEIGFFSYIIIIWATLLFGGLFWGGQSAKSSQRMPRWTRLGSSCVLVIGAWIWAAVSLGTVVDWLITWLALGMFLSLLGDILLSGILERRRELLEGIGAFSLAHLAYITGIISISTDLHISRSEMGAPILVGVIASGMVGWYGVVFFRQPYHTLAHYASLPYTLLLSATAALSIILALQHPIFMLMSVGAILFLLSDLVLGMSLFRWPERFWLSDVVWVLYGTGQMLIVFGVLLQIVLNFPAA